MRSEAGTAGSAGTTLASHSQDALQAWKEADDSAWEAERRLYAAWHAYRSSGHSVPALLQHRATTARALARRRLDEAIAASKTASQQGG
jgi:ferric-dicitrate binding protein FerR (iron transport regulator)